MNGTTHKCGGVALATLTVVALGGFKSISIEQGVMLVTGASFGALLPDIDHKGSEVGKKLKPISKFVANHTEHRGFTHTSVAALIVAILSLGGIYILKNFYTKDLTSRVAIGIISGFLIWIALDTALNSMRPKFVHNKKIKKLLDLEYPSLVVLIALCTIFSTMIYNSLDIFALGVTVGYISHLLLDMLNPTGVPILYPYSKHRISVANIKTGKHEGIVSAICNIITIFCLIILFT